MDKEELLKLKELANLDKASVVKIFGKDNVQDGFFTCKTCGKQTPISEMGIVSSQVLDNILDPICNECREEFKKMKVVSIACIGCKEIIARMEPKKYKNGFETKAGHIYHIADCPKCNPEKYNKPNEPVPSPIIEEQLFNRRQK